MVENCAELEKPHSSATCVQLRSGSSSIFFAFSNRRSIR